MSLLDRPDLANAVALFRLSCHHSRSHNALAKTALETFGDHGAKVSFDGYAYRVENRWRLTSPSVRIDDIDTKEGRALLKALSS